MREDTKVVVDDTTIYEIDLNCYHCLSEQERRKYFPQVWRMGKPVWGGLYEEKSMQNSGSGGSGF